MMSASKTVECFHRITQFQAHRYCNLLASICEKECQQVHKSDKDQILVVSLEGMQQQYKRVMEILNMERNNYSNKLRTIYQSVLQEVQKHMKNSLKQMQAEILAQLMKALTIEKSLIEKLQNKRYERIKCFQLMSLIDETQPEQKLKKSALIQIYAKYKNQANKFRDSLVQGRPISNVSDTSKKQTQTKSVIFPQKTIKHQKQKQNPPQINMIDWSNLPKQKQKPTLTKNGMISWSNLPTNDNNMFVELYAQKNKQYKQLEQLYEKLKYQKKVLMTQKNNLQRELTKLNLLKMSNKKKKMILKTWNIAQIITKKIKKARNQNQRTEAQSINKESNAFHTQEIQSHQNGHAQQSNKGPMKSPVNENKSNIIQLDQNDLISPIKEPPQKAAIENSEMEEQQSDFFEYLRRKKIV